MSWKSRFRASALCATMLRDSLLHQFPKLADLPEHTEAIGGAVRDTLLGETALDVDVECDDPLSAGCYVASQDGVRLRRSLAWVAGMSIYTRQGNRNTDSSPF